MGHIGPRQWGLRVIRKEIVANFSVVRKESMKFFPLAESMPQPSRPRAIVLKQTFEGAMEDIVQCTLSAKLSPEGGGFRVLDQVHIPCTGSISNP